MHSEERTKESLYSSQFIHATVNHGLELNQYAAKGIQQKILHTLKPTEKLASSLGREFFGEGRAGGVD